MNLTPLINRTAVKALLLETAKANRAHKFTRVSAETLNEINERVRQACVAKVSRIPSCGKTI